MTVSPTGLVRQLSEHGFTLTPSGDRVAVARPASYPTWDDVPEAVRPLLSELKARQEEVAAYLRQWDSARQIHSQALDRLAKAYPSGCLAWGNTNRPNLITVCLEATRKVEAAFKA